MLLFLGLDLLGFLYGSNFFLFWDIIVKVEKDKWSFIGEIIFRKGK